MAEYRYEIDPRPLELGGGWLLHLIQDGEEVGGGVYQDFSDAQDDAFDWIDSRDS